MKFIRELIARKKDGDAGDDHFADKSNADEMRDELDALVPIEEWASKSESEPVENTLDEVIDSVDEKADLDVGKVEDGDQELLEAIVSDFEEDVLPQTANIWDMEDDAPSEDLRVDASADKVAKDKPSEDLKAETPPVAEEAAIAAPQPQPARSPARRRRNKTRLIGFEQSTGDIVDLFDPATAAAPAERAKFPVGWIIVTDGPGRGECFTLFSGMSQIGRGEDQAVQLDFGDNSISRTNHAAIVYDPESKTFFIGHGGKTNIVRLNKKPLISNEELKQGDLVRIGETTLRFVALCGEDFSWSGDADKEDEDVAIA